MSRSIQLRYIPVTVISQTSDLFLNRNSLEGDSRGSAMANHKKIIDAAVSLNKNCLPFAKEKVH